jgi:hypothetical protein
MIRILLGIDKDVWNMFVTNYKRQGKSLIMKFKEMVHNDVRSDKYR